MRQIVLIFLALGIAARGLAQPSAAELKLSPEALSDFQWFSGLDFPDVKGCPYVRVSTGHWSQGAGEPKKIRFTLSFLLATSGTQFTVFLPDLEITTFAKTPPNVPDEERHRQ